MHLGGIDCTRADIQALALVHFRGTGGMCRAPALDGSGRCECFNFCDCHEVKA